MEGEKERMFDEETVLITCSPSLKLFAGVGNSGKITLYRMPCYPLWVHHNNSQKCISICWHPESTYLFCVYCQNNSEYLFKILLVENGTELYNHPLIGIPQVPNWYLINGTEIQKCESLLNESYNLKIDNEIDLSYILTDLNKNPLLSLLKSKMSCVFLTFDDKLVIYLQGVWPFFSIQRTILTCFPSPSFSHLILVNREGAASLFDFKTNFLYIDEIYHVLVLLFWVKELIKMSEELKSDAISEFSSSLSHIIKILKEIHKSAPVSREFLRIIYFGIISPEISHLLSSKDKPSSSSFPSASSFCTSIKSFHSRISKLTWVFENLMSIIFLIKTSLVSIDHDKFRNFKEICQLEECVSLIHSSLVENLLSIHQTKFIEEWMVFATWLEYIKQFVNRDETDQAFFDTPVFSSLNGLGDDCYLRKLLVSFLTSRIDNYVVKCDLKAPFTTEKLNLLIKDLEGEISNRFSKLSNDSPLTGHDSPDCKSSCFSPKLVSISSGPAVAYCTFSRVSLVNDISVIVFKIDSGTDSPSLLSYSIKLNVPPFLSVKLMFCDEGCLWVLANSGRSSYLYYGKSKNISNENIEVKELLKLSEIVAGDISDQKQCLVVSQQDNLIKIVELSNVE